MKKCFGIVSWFPDKEPARTQRQERINRLFKQLESLWPDIDILVIAQNWKNFVPAEIANKLVTVKFDQGLGILKARQVLRIEFLKHNYDYIIMFDDDGIIQCDNDTAAQDYMTELDKHPNGFCFIHYKDWQKHEATAVDTYKAAQLNLCAISRFIYEKENIPDVDPHIGQGYEDHVYSALLHHKYRKYEFYPPETIRHTQFLAANEAAPSTWFGTRKTEYGSPISNTNNIIEYISKHKDLPNLEVFWKYDVLIDKDKEPKDYPEISFRQRRKPFNGTPYLGRKGTYLSF